MTEEPRADGRVTVSSGAIVGDSSETYGILSAEGASEPLYGVNGGALGKHECDG